MFLSELCDYAKIACPPRWAAETVTGVCSDTSRVREGSLFVCLRGLHRDSHEFAAAMAERGAFVVAETGSGVTGERILYADNTRRALAFLHDAFHGYPSRRMTFVGVTGTNGKTSVTTMLKAILDAAGIPTGLVGTVICLSGDRTVSVRPDDPLAHMTTPDPEDLYPLLARMADDGTKIVVMEASSHALALDKLSPLFFDLAIFTNLSRDHLDFHGSMSAYFEAKARLFFRARRAILPLDDPYGRELVFRLACEKKTCSLVDARADYTAENVQNFGIDGLSYTLRESGTTLGIRSPVPGRFSVANSLEAIAGARELGVSYSVIEEAVRTFPGVRGRLERVKLDDPADFSVFIDYAHTPDALENLLLTVREFHGRGKIVLVFGCGGDRDRGKRPQMGEIASRLADEVIVTSDNSRGEDPQQIMEDILAGIGRGVCRVIPDRREAITAAVTEAGKNDIILLAGKGHESYEIDRNGDHPFDEAAIVRQAVKERKKKSRSE